MTLEELIDEMHAVLQQRDMPAYPIAAKQAGVEYTDYLTGAHKAGPFNVGPGEDYVYTPNRNRQCSIGYHDECTDPSGEQCGCVCHTLAGIIRRAAGGESFFEAAKLALSLEGCVTLMAAELERLRTRERELIDAGGNLHFSHPIFGPPHLVAASKRWCGLVDNPNGGELQKLTAERDTLKAELLQAASLFKTLQEEAQSENDRLCAELAEARAEHEEVEAALRSDHAAEMKAFNDQLKSLERVSETIAVIKLRCELDDLHAELAEARVMIECKNVALKTACEALDEDMVVHRTVWPDGRVETTVQSEQATQLRELREAAGRHVRVFDEFADMVVPTPETAVYAPPLGEATETLREVLASLQPSAAEGE